MTEKQSVPLQPKLPTIAIVGRPNVGKSSLFNSIIGRRMSIVHEQSGVTRDRVIAPAAYAGRHFQLVDTGGLGTLIGEKKNVDLWDERITEQALAAVEDADILIMVCNVQDGVHNLDLEVARRLRTMGKTVLVAANKCDNPTLARASGEFGELGFGEVFPVSCLHHYGVDRVLSAAVAKLPAAEATDATDAAANEPESRKFRIAVVGRPNVGKSSLVNALLGDERVIVSEVAGTTRDAIDIDFEFEYRGERRPAVLVDTAGLRRRGKVDSVVEYFSAMRAQSAIERANLVLFVVEASPDGVTSQDKTIASMIEKAGKGCVVVGNKFDLWRDDYKREQLEEELRRTLPGMRFAPVVFTSAKERRNLGALLDQMSQVLEQTEVKISTGLLNRVIADAMARRTPPVVGPSPLKIYYASMIGHEPPRALLFVNEPKYCAANYLAYLKNALRTAFDLTGLPIEIVLRARPKKVQSFHSPERTTRGAARGADKGPRGGGKRR
jgi:GTP-binding protein